MREIENNRVSIIGEVMTEFKFSHEVFGEGFYTFEVLVNRFSGKCDRLPLMISERLIDVTEDYSGKVIEVMGHYRSYNYHEGMKNRLMLSIFVRDWNFVGEEVETSKTNQIYLEGFICKTPIYRKTPLGREIADLLVAVNRSYGKSDYIPCIAWGRNARFITDLEVGSKIRLQGRIQSREYCKRIGEGENAMVETRTAYEVSIAKLEVESDVNLTCDNLGGENYGN